MEYKTEQKIKWINRSKKVNKVKQDLALMGHHRATLVN